MALTPSLTTTTSTPPAPPPYTTPLIAQAQLLANHSGEWGSLSEALLEWFDPQYAVFAADPFPNTTLPWTDPNDVEGLKYAARHIELDQLTLVEGDGSAGDPASLGVSALLLGAAGLPGYTDAAQRQYTHLMTAVPRWPNGAISQREAYPELWADFVTMAPPFMAYYAVATGDALALMEAGLQIELYAEVLEVPGEGCACRDGGPPGGASGGARVNTTTSTAGLWRHIAGPSNADPNLWTTGNGYAAYGALRVLATTQRSPFARSAALTSTCARLAALVKRILDAAICLDAQNTTNTTSANNTTTTTTSLLPNYLTPPSSFNDAAGTALLAASAYRAAALDASTFPADVYAAWADAKRTAVEAVVDPATGVVGSAVDPMAWGQRAPAAGSADAQSFAIMMFAAYRDFVVGRGV